LPIELAGDAVALQDAVDVQLEEIESGFGGNFPPVTEPPGAVDDGAKPGLLGVEDRTALSCRNTVVGDIGFDEPVAEPPGVPLEVGIVERLAREGLGRDHKHNDILSRGQPSGVSGGESDWKGIA